MRCGRVAAEQHHLSAKDDTDTHMNPELWVWLCKPCHLADHNTRHILELQHVTGRLTVPERIELCLRRVAAFLGSLGDPWSVLTLPLAGAMSGWADDLAGFRQLLDGRYPDWRAEIG
jgi:hypothetical protein